MIAVTLNSAKLDYALQRLASAARVDLGKVIKQEGGNVAKSIMLIIPPTPVPGSTKPRGSGLSTKAKQQGENAIKSDLFGGRRRRVGGGAKQKIATSLGIFQRIGNSQVTPPKRARTETVNVRLGWDNSKSIRIYWKFWKPSASVAEMNNFHLRYRNQYGRIGYVSQNTIGRWKVQDQMWISNETADNYLNWVQSRVGWAKAGFASAALACGIRIPAWVRRHAPKAGTSSVNFGANPYVIGTATAIKVPNPDRYVNAGLEFRKKITLKKVDAILANRAVNLGFARVDGAGRVQENMPQ
jgi:hypothetical protein